MLITTCRLLILKLVFSSLLAIVTAIPKLPGHLSQVQEALQMIDGPPQGRLQEPKVLGERLARLAILEADPDQPYGMHLALQSLAFYRMLIDRYVHSRVTPIFRRLVDSEPQIIETLLVPGKPWLNDLNIMPAYQVYDRNVHEFWSTYASSYIEAYLKRVRLEKEPGIDSMDDFRSKYLDLPKDKKLAFTYLRDKDAEELFNTYREAVFGTTFHGPGQDEMWKRVMQDPHILRKVTSVGASTSHRSLAS